MKIRIKKIISGILVILIAITPIFSAPITVSAFPGNYYWQPSNMHVRIKHVHSGLYLGISNEDNEVNGGRLELQRYDEGNQLQIFYLKKIGTRKDNGTWVYQIRVHGENNKVIEVRNGSKDDWAEVAQWNDEGQSCAYWQFYTENGEDHNRDATCVIKNWNSGKLLNVANGIEQVGNDLIQYHEDNTTSEVFRVECVSDDEEVVGATWVRDWSNAKGLSWSMVKDTESNRKRYYTPINVYSNGYIGYPVNYSGNNNEIWLAAVLWMDGNLMNDMRAYLDPPSSGWDELKKTLDETGRDFAVDVIMSAIGAGAIPVGSIMGVVSVIATGQEQNQEAIFKQLMSRYSKVKIEIWYNLSSTSLGFYPVYRIFVNDQSDPYWDGKKSSIGGNTYYCSYNNTYVDGSIEYFFK